MDEHAKTEQDLNEEFLHQITGGCGHCEYNKSQMKIWEEEMNRHNWIAEGAAIKGDRRTAREQHELAEASSVMASLHQAEIDGRLGTPGHPPAPGASSSSFEPPLQRRRLQ